jgi:FkbM family methyltransferase
MTIFDRASWPPNVLFFEGVLKDDATLQQYYLKLKSEVEYSYSPSHSVKSVTPDFEPNIVVDMGANIGAFSVNRGFEFKEIHAFEPSLVLSEICAILARTGESTSNPHYIGNKFFIYRFAGSDKTGEIVKLYGSLDQYPGNSNICERTKTPLVENCMTISLEDIFKLIGHEYIDYMKIDIEGAEYPFLMDKDLSQIGFITMEKHACLWEKYSEKGLLNHMSKYMHLWRTYEGNPMITAINKNYKLSREPRWYDEREGKGNASIYPMRRYIKDGKWE